MMLSDLALVELASEAYRRTDVAGVDAALSRLEVAREGALPEFYRRFAGPFVSRRTGFELLDLYEEGARSVEGMTRTLRERFGVPKDYLVLTDFLGGGVLVWDSSSGAVFSVDFEGGLEDLLAGRLSPKWESFEAFVSFYLG
ncbi:hypothetical protein [Myxococcus landrumensis]|uniref:Knr4/Smi1-like domain-containing protein n=1 Tax=Myxococcus landrumensis TaxID=2813577 RepID=A0ABX7N175_9BACT|nr:hypothetical protein [Myxococcus landrumus]QSQ11374.1 hypothetical protein JY572_23505 [Myxococcus landrumus]